MNLILQRLVANAQRLPIAHPLRTEICYLVEITYGLENHPFPANIIKKALVLKGRIAFSVISGLRTGDDCNLDSQFILKKLLFCVCITFLNFAIKSKLFSTYITLSYISTNLRHNLIITMRLKTIENHY